MLIYNQWFVALSMEAVLLEMLITSSVVKKNINLKMSQLWFLPPHFSGATELKWSFKSFHFYLTSLCSIFCLFTAFIVWLFAVPPLFVIEFLHRVMDIFEDYFTECTESIIKENYVVVYEVRKIVCLRRSTLYRDPLTLSLWCWNRNFLENKVSGMATDVLVMQGARPSAIMLLCCWWLGSLRRQDISSQVID